MYKNVYENYAPQSNSGFSEPTCFIVIDLTVKYLTNSFVTIKKRKERRLE